MHEEIIKKLVKMGRNKGYIPIREYALVNVGINTNERIDVAWLDKKGNPIFAFEVQQSDTPYVEFSRSKLENLQNKTRFTRVCLIIFNKNKTYIGYLFDPNGEIHQILKDLNI